VEASNKNLVIRFVNEIVEAFELLLILFNSRVD